MVAHTRHCTLLAHASTYNLRWPFKTAPLTPPTTWGTCSSWRLLLNKQLQPSIVRRYLQRISAGKYTIMSTRKLRPRAAKITDAFSRSKHTDADWPDLTAPETGGARGKIAWRKLSEVQVAVHKPVSPSPSVGGFIEDLSLSQFPELREQLSSDCGPPPKKRARGKGRKPQKMKDGLRYLSGITPYPDLVHPTPEECYKVTSLLTAAHGPAIRPEMVPESDNEVSGCGEAPSVLDALMKAILSANASSLNSSMAFQGLVERYGLVTSEPNVGLGGRGAVKNENGMQVINMIKRIGEGSIDWDNVRKASVGDLREAIRSGGLAAMKAKNMKGILDNVYKESQERIKAELEAEGIKIDEDGEIQGDVSIEYLRHFGDDEVMQKLMNFKGVGCKIAACVALFCLGRPKFPVDTHAWRISKFLSWVPDNATREDAYYHLDARVPNELKYALHNLLIRHGQTCVHCKAGPEQAAKSSLESEGIPAKRPHSEGEDTYMDDSVITGERRVKTKKVWVGTGMMREVIVEVPTRIEGPEEKELEVCVLEELVNRVRKPAKGRDNQGSALLTGVD